MSSYRLVKALGVPLIFISGHSRGVVLWICGACDGILVRSYSGCDALKCNHRAVGIGSHYRIIIPLLL